MAKLTLLASPEGIKQAKQAFANSGWTQADLAREVGIKTRQPIARFFSCQPVDRGVFIKLCFALGLNWQEIADIPKGSVEAGLSLSEVKQTTKQNLHLLDDDNIDAIVERMREILREKIQHQCGTLRLLDVAFPVNLDDIYVEVNIQQQREAQRWLELSDWQTDWEKLLPKRVSALEAVAKYDKLTILGKPGSGKTTFLQYLALQANLLPIFIQLKDFAVEIKNGTSLLEYISEELEICGITGVEKLLTSGRMLILLDGLNETQKDSDAVLQQIRAFSARYYKNKYAIATRTGAFSHQLQGFVEVEIADFNQQQIEAFATKWFVAVAQNNQKACEFIKQLKLEKNRLIRELAATPLLLNFVCWVFDAKANFPQQRAKLYREALDILLFRWDRARGIQRDEVDLKLLSYLATVTFEQGEYFDQAQIERYIADYLLQLPDAQLSETVLTSLDRGVLVERSRGIYSFSRLIQAYLTAKQIANSGLPALQQLVTHITENHRREIFLIVAEMLSNADALLQMMKQQIDALLAGDETLQQFLKWVNQKSWSFQENRQLAAVRAFNFCLACTLDRYLALALNVGIDDRFPPLPDFTLSFVETLDSNFFDTPDLAFAIEFDRKLKAPDYTLEPALRRLCELELIVSCALNFDLARDRDLALELQNSLQQLKAKVPQDVESSHFQAWIEQLKAILNTHRDFGHDWHFSDRQKQLLDQYYEANQLLVDCLNSGCQVTNAVRQQIEATLLLPSIS